MLGECPRWYQLVSAARYLGTDPFTLRKQPSRYITMAYLAAKAEAEAEENKAELAKARAQAGVR